MLIGGNYGTARQRLVGGPYDDKIWSGYGNEDVIRVYGDKTDFGDPDEVLYPGGGLDGVDSLIEFPDTFNTPSNKCTTLKRFARF